MTIFKSALLTTSLLCASFFGQSAVITQADFKEALSLPFQQLDGTRLLESINATIIDGPEITEANEIDNPGNFSGHADMDLDESGLLTLTGREPSGFADYQLAIFTISNIMFDTTAAITGVDIIGVGDELFSDLFGDAIFTTPDLSYTADSITITYAVGDIQNEDEIFNFGEGLSAQFQIVFAEPTAVSAPASIALIGLGLIALVNLRKRPNLFLN